MGYFTIILVETSIKPAVNRVLSSFFCFLGSKFVDSCGFTIDMTNFRVRFSNKLVPDLCMQLKGRVWPPDVLVAYSCDGWRDVTGQRNI